MTRTIAAIVLAATVAAGFVAPARAATAADLQAVSDRGRYLAAYDRAAWHGSDAVMSIAPKNAPIELFLAHPVGATWVVDFGKLSADASSFDVTYEATQAGDPKSFTAVAFAQPRHDTGVPLAEALAATDARKLFVGEKRPYNFAVMPRPDGNIYVYIYPAMVSNDSWPLGGDERFLYSSDGKTMIERTRLHKSILDMQLKGEGSGQIVAGMNMEFLFDLPQDTDVFKVLSTGQPQYVTAQGHMYYIDTTGVIEDKGALPVQGSH